MPPLTTAISPVRFFPDTASAVQFRGVGFDGRPSYFYQFGNIIPGTPESGPIGEDNDDGFIPATEDAFTGLPSAVGNVAMTQAQFDAWPEGDDPEADNEYQIDCLCANLGVTRK